MIFQELKYLFHFQWFSRYSKNERTMFYQWSTFVHTRFSIPYPITSVYNNRYTYIAFLQDHSILIWTWGIPNYLRMGKMDTCQRPFMSCIQMGKIHVQACTLLYLVGNSRNISVPRRTTFSSLENIVKILGSTKLLLQFLLLYSPGIQSKTDIQHNNKVMSNPSAPLGICTLSSSNASAALNGDILYHIPALWRRPYKKTHHISWQMHWLKQQPHNLQQV